jgi:hypothetical protein
MRRRFRWGRYLLLVAVIVFSALFFLPEVIDILYPQEQRQNNENRTDGGSEAKDEKVIDGLMEDELPDTVSGSEKLEGFDLKPVQEELPDVADLPFGNPERISDTKKDIHISLKELLAIQQMSLGDKLIGLSILYRLDGGEHDRLIALAQGGITEGEMETIQQILERKLSTKDLDKLYSILDKNRKLYAEGKFDN